MAGRLNSKSLKKMGFKEAASVWPVCKVCDKRAQYWSAHEITVVRKVNGKPQLINDGIWYFCRFHVPSPNKWFALTAEDVRENLTNLLN